MASVEQILQEQIQCSEMSLQPSFTLQDILKQPAYEYQDEDELIDDIDAYFQQQQQPQQIMPYDMSQRYTQQQQSHISNDTTLIRSGTKQFMQVAKQSRKSEIKMPTIQEHRRLADLELIPLEQIQNMIYVSINNVTQLFDPAQSKGIGLPTCITSTGSRFLAIGTSLGYIIIFENKVKSYKSLYMPDSNNIGQVTSVAISRDNKYLVAGYQSGVISIWDMYSMKLVKSQIIRAAKIIKVLFCSQNYENFIVNDAFGFTYMYTIQSKFWVSTKYQLLVDRQQNKIYYDVKYSKLQSQRHIVALCSLDQVTLISLKPNIGIIDIIKRPQNVIDTKIPNCEVGVIDDKDILCISWGKLIYIYKLVPRNYSMQKVAFIDKIDHQKTVHNMQLISKNIIITMDDSQVFRTINLSESLLQKKCKIVNTKYLQNQTIYQRFLKDKKGRMIKLYSNTVVNCSFDPKNKQIFFITKNAVYRGRLEKWTNIVHSMIGQQKNWLQSLKLCSELYRGNLNIFLQPFNKNKNTASLLCDIGRIYLKQNMNQIRNKNIDQTSIKYVADETRQVFQITIQYFLLINCQDYLFKQIFNTLVKQTYYYQYYDLLLQSLQPFIENMLLTKIPYYQTFRDILNQYSNKPQIINKLVTQLDQKSLHYQDLVDICTQQKLYEALCYICAINGDFLSPANKVMGAINISMNEKVNNMSENQKNKVYSILKNYIQKLVDLKYPNNKPIDADRKTLVLQQIQIWISSELALQFFVKQHLQDFFKIVDKLVKSLIKQNLQHFVIDLCQQLAANFHKTQVPNNESSKQVKDKYLKSLANLLIFMINCSLLKQIHFYTSLVYQVMQIQLKILQTTAQDFFNGKNFGQGLKFIDKYILPNTIDKIKGKNINEQKQKVLDYFEKYLFINLNPNLQGYYLIQKSVVNYKQDDWVRPTQLTLQQQDTIAKKISTNHIGTNKRDLVIHILNSNHTKKTQIIVQRYLDLMIKWAPQPIIVYLFQKFGIEKVNSNLKQIKSQKQQYLIVRKIFKFMRKNQQLPLKIMKKKSSKAASIIFGMHRESQSSENIKSQQIAVTQTLLDRDIVISYVRSLCKYKKQNRIFYQLSKYPCDYAHLAQQILPIAQQYKLKSCQAILHEYLMNYSQAFVLYAQVYEDYFIKNLTKLVCHEHCHGRFMANIFHLQLQLCYRIKKQENWRQLIRYVLSPLEKPDPTKGLRSKSRVVRIIDTIQKIYDIKSTKNHPFIHQLQQVIQATIISASRQIPMSIMAQELSRFHQLLGKTFILNCLTSTLYNSYKRVESFEISKELMVLEYVNEFKKFYNKSKIKGNSVGMVCARCIQKFQEINSRQILLSCGHIYHERCVDIQSHLSSIINTQSSTKCKVCTSLQFGDENIRGIYDNIKTDINIVKGYENQEHQLSENNRIVYRCLGFDDFMDKKQDKFEDFCKQYERNIQNYKQN